MIQIYKKGNTEYEMNGDHVIDAKSCILDRTLNGAWELTLYAPLDKEGKLNDITVEGIIKAPAPEGEQLYYIYDTDKTSNKMLEVSARPVFLLSARDTFILDSRPTNKTGQEALDILTAGTRYSGRSDITTTETGYYVRKNLIQAINGEESSFVSRWGGEIVYNNFEVVINERMGGDYGNQILYGKNLKSIREKCNMEELVTRIIPVAYNGYTLGGDAPWVDSPLINSYESVHYKEIRYDDVKLTADCVGDETGYDTMEDLQAELIRRAKLEFDAGIDKPKITLEVDMVDLSKTKEYKDYQTLEQVNLGDTVYCQHTELGIITTARVIRQKWDCILKRNTELTIGQFQTNYFSKMTNAASFINQIITPDGNIMAGKVQGILDGIYTQLRIQSSVAKKVEGRAFIVEDTDPESPLYGCMTWGTQGLQIASKRTEDGKDWDWETAVTAKGIVADAIITGILADKTGSNYWNLDTGDFRLTSTAFRVDGVGIDEYIKNAASKASGLSMILSNEYQGIPTDNEGNYTSIKDAATKVMIMYGETDVTMECSFDIQTSEVEGNWEKLTGTYTVTALTADEGYVDITAAYLGVLIVTKRFNLTKVKAGEQGETGAAGTVFILEPSATIIKREKDKSLSESYIDFCTYYREGNSAARKEYAGRFLIEETADGQTWTTIYESASDETSVRHILYTLLTDDEGLVLVDENGYGLAGSREISEVRCSVYESGGTTNLLDRQTIVVVKDVDSLSHEEIFNLLTNDGIVKGIYKEGNQLYISATYIKSGQLTVGGSGNGYGKIVVLDASGNQVGSWDNGGITATKGTFGGNLSGAGGTFSGNLSAAGGTFKGSLSAATGAFAGDISAASGTFKGSLESKTTDGKSSVYLNGAHVYFRTQTGESTSEYNQQYAYIRPEGYSVVTDGLIEDVTPPALVLSSNYDVKIKCAGTTVFHARYNSTPKLLLNSISTSNLKSRVVENTAYGDRLLYCYETPTPYFGDLGTAKIGENGICCVDIDPIFAETVNINTEYQVFLQKEGPGDLWIEEKDGSYFVVKGTPGLKFSWEVKVMQKGFEYLRIDDTVLMEEQFADTYDLELMADAELAMVEKEMEELINEYQSEIETHN